MAEPLIGIVMGSQSDWDTMRAAAEVLSALEVSHEVRIVSAHRTPDRLFAYAEAAAGRGLAAIIAGAGGAAHLPGMLAAKTRLPVLGVPVQSKAFPENAAPPRPLPFFTCADAAIRAVRAS
jgi:5-(carboxyamino)imidazole ribonucleotide mutase